MNPMNIPIKLAKNITLIENEKKKMVSKPFLTNTLCSNNVTIY